jgi:hypothetical protein
MKKIPEGNFNRQLNIEVNLSLTIPNAHRFQLMNTFKDFPYNLIYFSSSTPLSLFSNRISN